MNYFQLQIILLCKTCRFYEKYKGDISLINCLLLKKQKAQKINI